MIYIFANLGFNQKIITEFTEISTDEDVNATNNNDDINQDEASLLIIMKDEDKQ